MLERRVQDLVAGLNGLTFAEADGNAGYVHKITPLIRTALQRAIEAEREACAQVAENACLTPPDGGCPTADEAEMCNRAARFIRARSDQWRGA